jgi:hypothetical protein
MTLLQERLRTTKDFVTDRSADVATAGTISNLSVTGTSFLRLTAVTTLETIVADTSGKEVTIVNANTVSATIQNETGSTAANRIITGTGGNITWPAGAGCTFKYDDAASRWRIASIVSAGGDVSGPASVTDGRVAVFDGTTGKLLKQDTRLAADLVAGVASSVDSEIALFSGTGGKTLKRATGTGYAKVSSGVLQTPSATIPVSDVAQVNPTFVTFEGWNPNNLSSSTGLPTVRTVNVAGGGNITVGAISSGAVTFTFNDAGTYRVLINVWHTHAAAYTENRVYADTSGTASRASATDALQANGLPLSSNGGAVNDIIVTPTVGQTLIVSMGFFVTGSGVVGNHVAKGTVCIQRFN